MSGLALHPPVEYPLAMEEKEALIALNMIDHVGPVRLRQLLDYFSTPAAVLSADADTLMRVQGIGRETAEAIASWEETVDLSGELARIQSYGCQVITGADPEYPTRLREIYDPPIVLYVKGTLLERDNHSIAVVGSRQTTSYGTETARRFSYQFAHVGVTVVSGGARGIDTAAHQGALSAKGRTIAVLGTGINIVFPAENAELFERIAANGAVITQFPFNRPADRQSFPIRNRLVAGMTLGTLVVEAALNSGAMITANFAVDYGRQIFAIPGRIDSPRSKGCHDLIKKGAKLCESASDVLGEFEYLFPAKPEPQPASAAPIPLAENEQKILLCLADGEQSIDEIIRATSLPSSTVSVALLGLEMKRLIKQHPGKIFSPIPRS